MNEKCVFRTINLAVKFDEHELFREVNLSFNRGEIIALVGKNGIGKTIFLKTLLMLNSECSGEVLYKEHVSKTYLPDETYLYDVLTGRENLEFMLEILKISEPQYVQELAEVIDFTPYWDIPVKEYSFGTKKKLGLILSYLEMSDIFIFDEPDNGLDEHVIQEIGRFIQSHSNDGVTILSTHSLVKWNNFITHVLKFQDNKTIVKEVVKK
ncbi:MAG: AAA family ATPase [Lactobacillales bacterium]|jgi:ABC-type multidrug transport system ATPase subunit|nr:AAA family ATPase [Lactobacillales bacterium]